MPIYEYKCAKCGHEKEIMQKFSDPKITKCPHCNEESFDKVISLTTFKLKGNGYYATDFKNKVKK